MCSSDLLDNILIYLAEGEDYKEYIRLVLEAFLRVDSRLKLEKCEFRVIKTIFLGYILKPRKMSINPKKIKEVKD